MSRKDQWLKREWLIVFLFFTFLFLALIPINFYQTSAIQEPNVSYKPNGSVVTTNWKTYRNEEYRFELRYPENFFSKEYSSRIRRGGEKFLVGFADKKWESQGVHNPELIVSVIATELSPQEWLEEYYDPAVISNSDPPFGYRNVQETTVNGMAAIQFQFLTTSDSSANTIIQGKPGTLYRIAAISSGLGNFPKELYEQILSSFKFLE